MHHLTSLPPSASFRELDGRSPASDQFWPSASLCWVSCSAGPEIMVTDVSCGRFVIAPVQASARSPGLGCLFQHLNGARESYIGETARIAGQRLKKTHPHVSFGLKIELPYYDQTVCVIRITQA